MTPKISFRRKHQEVGSAAVVCPRRDGPRGQPGCLRQVQQQQQRRYQQRTQARRIAHRPRRARIRRQLARPRPRHRHRRCREQSYMDSIYGELFELTAGGKTTGDLATSYTFTNAGKTVVINLGRASSSPTAPRLTRPQSSSTGTVTSAATCTCKPVFLAPPQISATGPLQVSLTLPYVDAPFINGLQGNVFNWIASPTAIQKMGETAFALTPVGAGPYTVVTDTPDSELVLKANPLYWEKARRVQAAVPEEPDLQVGRRRPAGATRRCRPALPRRTKVCPRRSSCPRSSRSSR